MAEEKTPDPQPEKPKPDVDTVFNHVHQLLMNDELLEDYFIKHRDRMILELLLRSHKYNVRSYTP